MGLGDILGLTPNTAGSGALALSNGYLGSLGNVAAAYGSLASQSAGQYSGDNASYRQALQNQSDLLQQGFGNQDRAGYIAGQTANVGGAYQQGQANLTNDLSARGLGMSGSAAGGLADLDASRAGAYSTAANQAQNYFSNAQLQRSNQLTNLLGGAASTDYGRQTSALGAQGGLDSTLAGDYSAEAQAQYQRQAAQNAGLFGSIGSIATGLGGLVGRSVASKALGDGSGGSSGGNVPGYGSWPTQTGGQGYAIPLDVYGLPVNNGYSVPDYGTVQY